MLVRDMTTRERELTPPEFAEYLIGRIYKLVGYETVIAALWVHEDTWYQHFPGIEIWDGRAYSDGCLDARRYKGPWPVIAHPPCGPWGRLKAQSRESPEHGISAMRMVHRWGGVVEQPLGSSLFSRYGAVRGRIQRVDQRDFGHRALKPTLLYWYKQARISDLEPSPSI